MFSFCGHLGVRVERCGQVTCVMRQIERRYARMVSRQPVRVHLPQPHTRQKVQQAQQHYEDMLTTIKKTSVQKNPERKVRREKEKVGERQGIITKKEVDIKHDIQHQLLADAKHYIRTLLHNMSSRKFREENELFVAEGERIVKESLDVGARPEAIFFTRLSQLVRLTGSESSFGMDELCTLNELPLYRAPYKTLQMWSALSSSPGIVGVFKVPTMQTSEPQTRLPLRLVLDEIREPANLGGILRTAAAVGASNVILMKGCCDPWERKVVRAGCGAHFRLKFTVKATWDSLSNHLPENMQLLVADLCHNNNFEDGTGGDDRMSSGNPIRNTHQYENRNESYEGEFDSIYEIDSEGNKVVIDPRYNDTDHLHTYQNIKLRVTYYDDLKLHPEKHEGTVVIIGGETGLSNAAKKFATENFGTQVAIPMANGMDSLNSSVASGIVLYEISKQYRQ